MVLQEETQEYLEEAKLKELVARYSEFINFPIYLYASKEVDVPADEAADESADESDVSDEDEDTDDEEGVADDGESACSLSWAIGFVPAHEAQSQHASTSFAPCIKSDSPAFPKIQIRFHNFYCCSAE